MAVQGRPMSASVTKASKSVVYTLQGRRIAEINDPVAGMLRTNSTLKLARGMYCIVNESAKKPAVMLIEPSR